MRSFTPAPWRWAIGGAVLSAASLAALGGFQAAFAQGVPTPIDRRRLYQ